MYPSEPTSSDAERLFHRRNTFDFSNKAEEEYIPPPVSKKFEKKHSFVHNTLANKTQSNIDFIEKINSDTVLTAQKRKILSALHRHGIDFRMLRAFKNALFDSEELEENQYVPVQVFYDIGEYEMNRLFKGELN
jgi:hypothetical protein